MAWATGTATNYLDLLEKLKTFLTTNATLVSLNQEWEILATQAGGTDVLLRGPGLAEDDEIHVRITTASNVGADRYGWDIAAFVSYNPGVAFSLQPGISPYGGIALWNSAITYWFIASGRRFIVIAKVSTVYSSMYAGFYLQYATPTEMPYPMLIAGSHENGAQDHRWSQADYNVGGFWDPSDGNAFLRSPGGSWLTLANYTMSSSRAAQNVTNTWPYEMDLESAQGPDGVMPSFPVVIHSSAEGGNVFGELDGVLWVTGNGVGSEDTVTIDGSTYLIVQSVYRTTRLDYAAIRLE